MLDWIKIKNFAIVEEADIEFGERFNVITGETGAGKSVIIGTIALLLGGRADKSAIRSGSDRCEISAGITLRPDIADKIDPILDQTGIQNSPDMQLQVRRVITPASTRNFINDTPATLQTLKLIGDCLVDIHGANEHQSLLKQAVQLELVDKYGRLEKTVEECAAICAERKKVREEREKLHSQLPSPVEAEHLRMSVSEIEKVSPEPNEDRELSARHALAANSKQVVEISSRGAYTLNDSDASVTDRMSEVYRDLQELERIDKEKASSLLVQCNQICELIRELAFDIENFAGNIELDEKEFMELEERLSAIQTIKRRYGPSLEQVFETLENVRERLAQFQNSEEIRAEFDKRENALNKQLAAVTAKLSASRKKAGAKFSEKALKELNKLGFLKCEFSVHFEKTESGPRGCDKIDFVFSANPGEKVQPLRNVASSGEMSRVMLALKTVLADADSVPILVFDEIDVNIGGETASIVGQELKKLAKTHQVLCISHLAQVAAKADSHYRVEKTTSAGRTFTQIIDLDKKTRTQEITRMLGGSKGAMTHAKELLKN